MFICGWFSILGAAIVIVGLYLLLWGKEGDEVYIIKSDESSYQTYEEEKDSKKHTITSVKKDALHGEPWRFRSFPWNPLRKAHHESKFKTNTRNKKMKLTRKDKKQEKERADCITIISQLSFPQNSIHLFVWFIYGIWTSFIQEILELHQLQYMHPQCS